MYICIDLLLVALIIKVSPSTLSVSRTFIFKRESVCKAVAELLKIDPHWLQNRANLTSRDSKIKQNPPPGTPKMTKNTSLKQRRFQERLRSSIFGKIDDFLDLFFHQKLLKNHPKTMSEIKWFLKSLFHRFLMLFDSQNDSKSNLRRSTADLRKPLFYYGKTYVFEVRALRKTTFLHLETRPRKGNAKNMIFQ